MPFRYLVVSLLLSLHPSSGTGVALPQASRITIAVSFTDSTQQFASAFRAAFRGLGDVDVVTLAEQPQFVLGGVVLCVPDCLQPSQFSLALRLYAPAAPFTARFLADLIKPLAGIRTQAVQDTIADMIWRQFRAYERTHREWVATWGRANYEQAIREFVREIDSRCFERVRALERVGAADEDSRAARFAQYQQFERSREWIC